MQSTTPAFPASVVSTSPSDWRYVSEGGATIVFSYIGPPHKHLNGTVLRLRKTDKAQKISDHINRDENKFSNGMTFDVPDHGLGKSGSDFFQDDPDDECEPDDASIQFQQKIISHLLPSTHLPLLESVHVEKSWLEELAAVHNDVRPLERRMIDHIDIKRTRAVLATDLVGGDWVAVEIKPKWGFLPNPTHLSPDSLPLKSNTCRFCMHSHLKEGYKGQAANSAYCPLDLFSGNKARVEIALGNLWESWTGSGGSVNNLRVFVRGKMIKPDGNNTSLANELSIDGNDQKSLDELRRVFISSIVHLLLSTPVLRLLSTLQRTLDSLDIEGLSKLWKLSQSESAVVPTPIGSDTPEPTLQDWTEFINTFNTSPPSSVPGNILYHLHAYLLSATFKDCSIILRLPTNLTLDDTLELKDNSVTVIDLDPKSMERLKKWEKLDKDIVESYSLVTEDERKMCLDAQV